MSREEYEARKQQLEDLSNADADSNDKLDFEELKGALGGEDVAKKVLTMADADSDGEVSIGEMLKAEY